MAATSIAEPALAPRGGDDAAPASPALRWWAKKAGRLACALLTAPRRKAEQRGGEVRALTYHRFATLRRDPFAVAVEDFDRQMRWLAERGLAVSLADVREFLAGRKTLPDGAVLVTIDDGFACLRARALPILRRYAIPAVAFVPAGLIGANGNGGDARLDWDDVRALAAAGVAIGSHGWSHRSLGRLSANQAWEEAALSRREIEHHIGRAVDALAYPFGTRADLGPHAEAAVQAAGYACAFTAQHGALRPDGDPLLLPRVKVEGGEPPWMFARLCRGGLDAWRWVDRAFWRLQAAGS